MDINYIKNNIKLTPLFKNMSISNNLDMDAGSIEISVSVKTILEDDTETNKIYSILTDQFNSEFHLAILSKCDNNVNKTIFLNIEELDENKISELLYNYISKYNYKNCITDGKIGSYLFGSKFFHYKYNNLDVKNTNIFSNGSILNTSLYINSYYKHDNDTILLIDDVSYEISNIDCFLIDEATFRPRVCLKANIKILVNNFILLKLVYRNSKLHNEWLKINREDTINKIVK